ncbi:hypothetical protein [Marivirga arenosa]|uniref:Tetratricopeptide repeat protein n=1 Tax=Marivirga arenosa TaxID=3059076 RepID=A0AA49J9K5_9BACT|nr:MULTISPECIES: hypothetical protein [unclassified Marivirga]WKK81648.2 hypothetical protein QYS47_05090 [Marivirga sp. BKB1-2]WKK87599.2 hypothetical protein QYS48_13380 [Marivirga sp. ABR2-2]
MKSFIKILVVALWLGNYAANAQNYVFKVLANKGDNSVKVEGAEWTKLKTGQSLNAGDELKLSEEAYLGLMHNSGKTLEVKTPGSHTVSGLAANLKSKNSSVASKYADFVMNKMSDDGSSGDYRKSLGATGAVDRALASGASIKIMAQSSSEIINDKVILRWNEPKQEGEVEKLAYELTFTNLFDETIATETVDKTSYLLDKTKAPFKGQNFIKVKVKVKGEDLKSDDYAITEKPEEETAEIKSTLSQLKSEIEGESAMDKLVMAAFYEDNDLLLDALTAYEEAIQMAPNVPIFEKAYEDFLIRNGFTN